MKVIKKISLGGEFAKVNEDIKDGNVILILESGQTITGDYGDRQVFKIRTMNGDKILSFNQTSMNHLIDEFGNETENWKDKEVKVWIIKQMIQNKLKNVVYLTPTNWIMTEDGTFVPQSSSERNKEEINTEDIPF